MKNFLSFQDEKKNGISSTESRSVLIHALESMWGDGDGS